MKYNMEAHTPGRGAKVKYLKPTLFQRLYISLGAYRNSNIVITRRKAYIHVMLNEPGGGRVVVVKR